MNNDEFRRWSHRTADWAADYRAALNDAPVRASLTPGATANALPAAAPELAEPMENIFADFERIIVPGITHWQHPRFFAYFPSNAPAPSVVAEQLVNAMAAQCMLWQTSPSATELETRMLEWLRDALGLGPHFSGVIQEAASSSTFAAILTMREKALQWAGNSQGLSGQKKLRVYASQEVHTSVDKAIWMAGIGGDNFIRIPIKGVLRGMDAAALEAAIVADKAAGFLPAGIVACIGGTSVGGTDSLRDICSVARRHNVFVHVDAAWAGSAMICPEFRHLWQGIDEADSMVFNPHKWLGAQADCSVLFVREPQHLVKTLAIQPEYLKTQGADGIINYSEWSIVLGRRFRALKIWFLLRAYGLEGLRQVIRNHINWSVELAEKLRATKDFSITTEPVLSLFSFRHEPSCVADLDGHNLALVKAINDDGRIYITQSKLDGKAIIRFQAGSFEMQHSDVDVAYQAITEIAKGLTA
ncbi:MAG: aspartate aminotransferase family protein [Alphaproteobacteria bacterium]|nr:aspartate aminotransferase family protein [Alphaproteobacteria bacterium]